MPLDDTTRQELFDLLAAQRDGQLDVEGLARLESLVVDDAEARELYLNYIDLCASLHWAHAEAGDEPQAVAPLLAVDTLPSPPRRFSMATRHMAVGITIAVAFVVASISIMHQVLLPVRIATKGEGGGEKLTRDREQTESIARLVNDVDAIWEGHVRNPVFDRKQRIKTGMKLYPGQRLKLVSGLAEFKFFNGAEVVLEGPAEFEVLGKKQCGLNVGKLVAKAFEERSKGFIVDTPNGLVEDLGTVFGVSVGENTQVQVFEGDVVLKPSEAKKSWVNVSSGETINISQEGRVFVPDTNASRIAFTRGLPYRPQSLIGENNTGFKDAPIHIVDSGEPGFTTDFEGTDRDDSSFGPGSFWTEHSGLTARFEFNDIENGIYRVYSTWHERGGSRVPYRMNDRAPVYVNQLQHSVAESGFTAKASRRDVSRHDGNWEPFELIVEDIEVQDGKLIVEIGVTEGFSRADAVAIQRVGELAPPDKTTPVEEESE